VGGHDERMKDTAGRALAEALDEAVDNADPGAAARVMTRLAGLDGRGWLRLDEWARRTYWGRSPLGQAAGWPGRLAAGAGPRLLGSARAVVRAFAAGHLADDLLPGELVRELLADRSGTVRPVARWRWTRRGLDPGPVYRELLTAALPRQVAAALEGLDDVGDSCLPAAALPFLTHSSPRVRCAAVHAVGRHSEPADIPARLAPVLRDESAKVVTAALRYLRGYRLPPGLLAGLDLAGTSRSRRTALAIRQGMGPWDRVQADLTAINGPDPDLAETGRTDLLAWLQHDAASTYGRPSPGPGRADCRAARRQHTHRRATQGRGFRRRNPDTGRQLAAHGPRTG
jgi:hypothetical protein